LKILFTCGGSGGHINPALAIADGVRSLLPDTQILFVGGKGNMEMELVPKAGYEIVPISVDNLHRSVKPRELVHNVRAAWLTVTALSKVRRIIREFSPDVAVGTGGYVCFPALRAAASMGIPAILHESNVLPGLATRMLEKHLTKILLGFDESKKYFSSKSVLVVTGTPVRGEFRKNANSDTVSSGVLSFFGSLGSSKVNEVITEFAKLNAKNKKFTLTHAVGKNVKFANPDIANAEFLPYIYDVPQRMNRSALVICRAGASTLNELAAVGKPSILIPSPYVTGNHQEINARVFEQHGAAIVIRESELTPQKLYDTVSNLLANPQALQKMSLAAKTLDTPDALGRIVGEIV